MSLHQDPIRAVLFDFGLVLSGPPLPAAWERMKTILAASEADFHAAYWRHRHDYDLGVLNGQTYWAAVATDLGRVSTPELLDADTALWTQPNQPMIDWAKALQHFGYKTGLLSNIGDAMETGVLAHFPWLTTFTHLTFSHRLLIAKPNPAIYAYAIAGLDTPAHQILFIDDRPENIEGARNAGMRPIQYLSHPKFIEDMSAAGYRDILTPADSQIGT